MRKFCLLNFVLSDSIFIAQKKQEKGREEKRRGMAGMGGPVSQDWDPVVVRKKVPNAAAKKDEKAVNEARRSGGPIETIKKCKKNSCHFF